MKNKYFNHRLSFTLIELVVVCGLIIILVSVIGIDLSNRRVDLRIKAGQQLVSSMLMATRNQAILKHTNARLIIHYNPSVPDKYLRQMGIIYEETPDSDRWRSLNAGSSLPSGVYFNTEISSWTEAQLMDLDFPHARFQEEGSGEKWIYFEFTSTGLFKEPGAHFVIGAGILNPLGPKGKEIEYNNHTLGGIIIWKFGGVSFFTGTDEI